MTKPNVFVERVPEYYEGLAVDLGTLMPELSPDRRDDTPIEEEMIRPAIESPHHEIVVARSMEDGRLVGAASLSKLISFELKKPEFWLGGFVAHSDVRGQGVGGAIWSEILDICREHRTNMGWTSNHTRPDRADAIKFYKSHGAEERETTVFHLEID